MGQSKEAEPEWSWIIPLKPPIFPSLGVSTTQRDYHTEELDKCKACELTPKVLFRVPEFRITSLVLIHWVALENGMILPLAGLRKKVQKWLAIPVHLPDPRLKNTLPQQMLPNQLDIQWKGVR